MTSASSLLDDGPTSFATTKRAFGKNEAVDGRPRSQEEHAFPRAMRSALPVRPNYGGPEDIHSFGSHTVVQSQQCAPALEEPAASSWLAAMITAQRQQRSRGAISVSNQGLRPISRSDAIRSRKDDPVPEWRRIDFGIFVAHSRCVSGFADVQINQQAAGADTN